MDRGEDQAGRPPYGEALLAAETFDHPKRVEHQPAEDDEDPMVDYEIEDIYPDERA